MEHKQSFQMGDNDMNDFEDDVSDLSFDDYDLLSLSDISNGDASSQSINNRSIIQIARSDHVSASARQAVLTAQDVNKSESDNAHHYQPYILYGTIVGVVIPCLSSNMISGILFIRLPYILSQAGLWLTLLIMLLSHTSVVLTSLSLNAIATNGKIKKSGGLYHLARKILGKEIGGSVGFIHLFAKAITASMYLLAASEVLINP